MNANKSIFLELYRRELETQWHKNPEEYAWPFSEIENVYSRMVDAIERGTFSKDSATFRVVCKKLKIKHTYRDIETFLGGN